MGPAIQITGATRTNDWGHPLKWPVIKCAISLSLEEGWLTMHRKKRGNRAGKSRKVLDLDQGFLPRDMTKLPLNKPFRLGDNWGIVTECVPYLKRQREGEEN